VTGQVARQAAGQVARQVAGQMAGQMAGQVTEKVAGQVTGKVADPVSEFEIIQKQEIAPYTPDTVLTNISAFLAQLETYLEGYTLYTAHSRKLNTCYTN
jgi:hypothetical protein